MDFMDWNVLNKPSECDEFAEEDDIVEEIDGVFFLCQRRNNCNNIICFKKDSKDFSLLHIRSMFKFCILLYEKYGIEYIKVEGTLLRYRFLEKIFPKEVVIKDGSIKDRNVFYCNIKKANAKLRELSEHE